jgi:hypothetical protein
MPLCVVDRRTSFDRVEADLHRALLITVGRNRPSVSKHHVLEEISRSFNVVINSMVIMVTVGGIESSSLESAPHVP